MKSGSHLYGLNTPTSDEDYVGVYIEDTLEEFLNPFQEKKDIDLSIKHKDDLGKNTKDAVDKKYYHISKFIKLLTDNNPSILEMLFAPYESIIVEDKDFYSYVRFYRDDFLSKRIYNKFIGYALSQEQKSYTKAENYVTIKDFKEYLLSIKNERSSILDLIKNDDFMEKFKGRYTIEVKRHSLFNNEEILNLGELQFPSGLTLKASIDIINKRFNNATHRLGELLVHKYEPKFMSHTIRLLLEGINLLGDGVINFPFKGKDKDLIMSIKTGKLDVTEVMGITNSLKEKIENSLHTSRLRKDPSYNQIASNYAKLIRKIYEQ